MVSPRADTLESDDLPAADDDRMVVQVHRRTNVAGEHGKQVAVVDARRARHLDRPVLLAGPLRL